jgi:hypothetical protein
MKTTSWLLKVIRVLLIIIWYLNMIIIVVAFIGITLKLFTSDGIKFSTQVKYPAPESAIVKLAPLTSGAKNITIKYDQGLLDMNLKKTAGNIALAYFFFISIEALIMIIIYQLRKFFNTLMHNMPFQNDNIRRLKAIALCFALINLLNILVGISSITILGQQVKGLNAWNIIWTENFTGFILGAVIYVMADVFKYGFTLQKENGEFV